MRLSEPALRALAEPFGTTTVTVDPRLSAPPPGAQREPGRRIETGPQIVGALRVTAAAAVLLSF